MTEQPKITGNPKEDATEQWNGEKRHVLKPETPKRNHRSHRNHRNNQNEPRKPPEPPEPPKLPEQPKRNHQNHRSNRNNRNETTETTGTTGTTEPPWCNTSLNVTSVTSATFILSLEELIHLGYFTLVRTANSPRVIYYRSTS